MIIMGFVDGVWVDNALPDNVTDVMDIAQYNNEITQNMFGVGILFAVFLVMFVITGREARVSIPISLYITTVVGLFMAVPVPPLVGADIIATLIITDVIATIALYALGES